MEGILYAIVEANYVDLMNMKVSYRSVSDQGRKARHSYNCACRNLRMRVMVRNDLADVQYLNHLLSEAETSRNMCERCGLKKRWTKCLEKDVNIAELYKCSQVANILSRQFSHLLYRFLYIVT